MKELFPERWDAPLPQEYFTVKTVKEYNMLLRRVKKHESIVAILKTVNCTVHTLLKGKLHEQFIEQPFSNSRKPYDNEIAESFFATLKKESFMRDSRQTGQGDVSGVRIPLITRFAL